MKNIFIGPSVRNGGSLINRLFDHHPDVGAYPMELILPMDSSLHPSLAERGQKKNIQNYPYLDSIKTKQCLLCSALLNEDPGKCLIGSRFLRGRMHAKTTHMNVESIFDHGAFIRELLGSIELNGSVSGLYNNIHKAFFEHWDGGKHAGSGEFVAYHSGNGLLADLDVYFSEFDGYFIQPIRSVKGILSSEKKKVSRQLIGRGVIGKRINLSDKSLKLFYGRYIENLIVNWLIVLTRSVIMKKMHGERYIIYRHEDLVNHTDTIMQKISSSIGLNYNESLLTPTVAGIEWAGNSMYLKTKGLDKSLARVRDVFTDVEERLLDKYCAEITEHLDKYNSELVEFDDIPESVLFDYDYQEKYLESREKTALYFASMYERWKYEPVTTVIKNAFRKSPHSYFL